MVRRLTPDPLQVDPWTNPVRISISGIRYIRVLFRAWINAFGSLSGFQDGETYDASTIQYSMVHPEPENDGVVQVTALEKLEDGSLRPINTPDNITLDVGNPAPSELVWTNQIQRSITFVPFVELIHDHQALDESGDAGVESTPGTVTYGIKSVIRPKLRWWTVAEDDNNYSEYNSGVLQYENAIDPVIKVKNEQGDEEIKQQTISLGGNKFPLKPIGVRTDRNMGLSARRDEVLRMSDNEEWEPIVWANPLVLEAESLGWVPKEDLNFSQKEVFGLPISYEGIGEDNTEITERNYMYPIRVYAYYEIDRENPIEDNGGS